MDFPLYLSSVLIAVILFLFLRRVAHLEKIKSIWREPITAEKKLLQILENVDAKPIDIYQSLVALNKFAETYSEPRYDVTKQVLTVVHKHNVHRSIQLQAIIVFCHLKQYLKPVRDCALLQQILGITLAAMEQFPTDKLIQRNALNLLDVANQLPIDKWHCLKLLLNTLHVFENEDEETFELTLSLCDQIFYSIPREQLDIYADTSEEWRRTWSTQSDVDNDVLTLRKTLSVLWNVCALPPRNEDNILCDVNLDFFKETLNSFSDDATTQRGVLGVLHNICCKKQFTHSFFLSEGLLHHLENSLLSSCFSLSFAASKIIVKLLYHVKEVCLTGTTTSCNELATKLESKIKHWRVNDVTELTHASLDFNNILLKCKQPELQMYAVWFIYTLCSHKLSQYKAKIEKDESLNIITEYSTLNNSTGEMCKDIIRLVKRENVK